jgi:hypothetical protein
LKAQAKGMRHKYAAHLGQEGQAMVKRDREDDLRRLSKRAEGNAT